MNINKDSLSQFINQYMQLRTYDWYQTRWISDDESSLSFEEKIIIDRLSKDRLSNNKEKNN